jgi:fucose permease
LYNNTVVYLTPERATMATRRSALFLTLLIFVAFISLGLPDSVLGVASPSIRRTFGIPLNAVGLIFITGTIGYFLSSVSSGRLMARLGVGKLLALSSFLTAAAVTGYALSPAWGVSVALGFVSGLGAGAIDAGLNGYVAANRSERLMQWLHASFGVGTTLGPMIMTAVLSSDLSWRWGYAIVAAAQYILATCFLLTAGLWRGDVKASENSRKPTYTATMRETITKPAVWLGIAIFFIYAGMEVSVGQWSYTLFVESRDIAPDVAGIWVSIYWGTFTVGRIIAGLISTRLSNGQLLQVSMIGAVCGAVLLLWNPVSISGMFAVSLLGLSFAPIFPALVSNTGTRVAPEYVANTIGFQVAAASIGISLIPALLGVLADELGLEIIGAAVLVLTLLVAGVYSLIRANGHAVQQEVVPS